MKMYSTLPCVFPFCISSLAEGWAESQQHHLVGTCNDGSSKAIEVKRLSGFHAQLGAAIALRGRTAPGHGIPELGSFSIYSKPNVAIQKQRQELV